MTRALSWTPVALHLRVDSDDNDDTTAVILTIISSEKRDHTVTVWRQNFAPGGAVSWQLCIDGQLLDCYSGWRRPSPRALAGHIRRVVHRQRS